MVSVTYDRILVGTNVWVLDIDQFHNHWYVKSGVVSTVYIVEDTDTEGKISYVVSLNAGTYEKTYDADVVYEDVDSALAALKNKLT